MTTLFPKHGKILIGVIHLSPLPGSPRWRGSLDDVLRKALADVKAVRTACPKASILIGSGVTARNVKTFLELADGVIEGTSLKRGGKVENPVDPNRVAALRRMMSQIPCVSKSCRCDQES
ncbi:MAG: hypothetical protein HY735_18195 [Verrucomicrobia bacterium]|nr:hypothetical protein [Verrucomicrobiota bacterium]